MGFEYTKSLPDRVTSKYLVIVSLWKKSTSVAHEVYKNDWKKMAMEGGNLVFSMSTENRPHCWETKGALPTEDCEAPRTRADAMPRLLCF